LPDGSVLTLADFLYEEYSDGRPKTWISTVAIKSSQDTRKTSGANDVSLYTIKVNAPLRRKGYSVYQKYWSNEKQAILIDPSGMQFSLQQGMREQTQDGFVFFMTMDGDNGQNASQNPIFLLEQHGKRTVVKAEPGQSVGIFTYEGLVDQSVSGLAIVSDKGYPYVMAGFILVITGVFITYFQKLKGLTV